MTGQRVVAEVCAPAGGGPRGERAVDQVRPTGEQAALVGDRGGLLRVVLRGGRGGREGAPDADRAGRKSSKASSRPVTAYAVSAPSLRFMFDSSPLATAVSWACSSAVTRWAWDA